MIAARSLRKTGGSTAPREAHSFTRALGVLAKNRRFALIAGMSFFNQFAAICAAGHVVWTVKTYRSKKSL